MHTRTAASWSPQAFNNTGFSFKNGTSFSSSLSRPPRIKLPHLKTLPPRNNNNSFNFFSTRAVDKNEVITSDTINSPDTLLKLTKYQGHRTARWDTFCDGIYKPHYKDENTYRVARVKEQLGEFLKYKLKLNHATGRDERDIEAKLYSISEAILNFYNISLNIMTNNSADSHLEFIAIKSRSEVVRVFLTLIPELCKFPYSFYSKIDLISLSFCGSVAILQQNSRKLAEKRIFNGIFPVGNLRSEEQVQNHFYKILTYLIKTIEPDFDKKLTRVAMITKSRTMLMNSTNFIVNESIKKKKDSGSFDEQSKLLKTLICKPTGILHNASETIAYKGAKLKGILETVDSDGIDQDFWSQLGYNPLDGSLHDIEEVE